MDGEKLSENLCESGSNTIMVYSGRHTLLEVDTETWRVSIFTVLHKYSVSM